MYSLPPLISAVLFFSMGAFVFLKDKKSIINTTFALVCLVTVWWQFSWFILFNTSDSLVAEFLVRIGYMGIILIPVAFFHFFIYFLEQKNSLFDKYLLFFSYIISLIFEITLWVSDFFIDGYYIYSWGFYPKAGYLHIFYLALLTILALRILYLLFIRLKKKNELSFDKYNQAKYILIGMVFYIIASADFVTNYGLEIYPTGFLFIMIFLGMIAYTIVKFKLMNIKVIATQMLAVAITLITLTEIFKTGSLGGLIIRLLIFIITLLFSFLLIRSVLKEVKRREEMENLARQLSEATKKLQKANIQLKRLDEAKSEFISIASHQLRTPLTAIKGYGSMILEGDFGELKDPKQRDAVNKMVVSSDRLRNLVENLLNISRIESGRLKFDFQNIQLTDLIKDAVDDLRKSAEEKGLYLKFQEPQIKLPLVYADDEKIRQIVINFVDNAIKYTAEGGIDVTLEQGGNNLICCVKDTGMGVSKEEQVSLFKKFSRGKDAFSVNTKGTGLGLFVADKMIKTHKGRVWVESEGEGKGSKFCFSLPIGGQAEKKKNST